jgi:hypothetical protein
MSVRETEREKKRKKREREKELTKNKLAQLLNA